MFETRSTLHPQPQRRRRQKEFAVSTARVRGTAHRPDEELADEQRVRAVWARVQLLRGT